MQLYGGGEGGKGKKKLGGVKSFPIHTVDVGRRFEKYDDPELGASMEVRK